MVLKEAVWGDSGAGHGVNCIKHSRKVGERQHKQIDVRITRHVLKWERQAGGLELRGIGDKQGM